MIVFKACMKILKKNWIVLIIYFGIFTLMSVSMGNNAKENAEKGYEAASVKVSVINNDDSEYADSLVDYLEKNTKLTDIVETEEGISDALFYRYTEYVVVIPEDFGEKMAAGEKVELDKYEIAGSYSGVFMDNMINEYIHAMKTYGPETEEKAETNISFLVEETEENAAVYMYNFAAYALMAIIILGVGALLAAFGKADVKKRNIVSPMSGMRMGLLQLAGSFVFTVIVWGLISIVSVFVIEPENMTSSEIAMIINMFVFSLVCLAMGFCISTVVKSANGRDIVANVVALGFSFVGGVMIPVSQMGETTKLVGSFTPAYWFVKVNEMLLEVKSFTLNGLSDIWPVMGIQILFIVVFLGVGMAALKKQTT